MKKESVILGRDLKALTSAIEEVLNENMQFIKENYKRNAAVELWTRGNYTAAYIISEYQAIEKKVSDESRRVRDFISGVMFDALIRYKDHEVGVGRK